MSGGTKHISEERKKSLLQLAARCLARSSNWHDKNILPERYAYNELILSGMAWEFHPWLTGMWEKDCDRFIKEVYSKYADTEDKN